MSDFFDDFTAGLEDAAAQFGQAWSLVSKTVGPTLEYSAIEIETSSEALSVMAGGRFRDASATVNLFASVFTASGVKDGDIVLIRGGRYRVKRIETDDDGTRVLVLGSPQVMAAR